MSLTILEARPREVDTTRATVLFVDLRGYTRLAERLDAERVLSLLDEFCHVVSVAARHHGGHVFHVAGDGMMAGFGVHGEAVAGARAALAAGQAMLRLFAPIASRWHRQLGIESGIGIGLHLGEVALGPLGPPGRRAPTLVGDTVNVAARLCARARAGELLFSAAVAMALEDGADGEVPDSAFLRLRQVALRGRSEPLDVWCVPATARLAV